MTRHLPDCQAAIVIFHSTHKDHAGQAPADTPREGEIVGAVNREAIIAADSGDIMCVPLTASHRVDESVAELLPRTNPCASFLRRTCRSHDAGWMRWRMPT